MSHSNVIMLSGLHVCERRCFRHPLYGIIGTK